LNAEKSDLFNNAGVLQAAYPMVWRQSDEKCRLMK
jgi:hypothetical protein